MKSLWRTIARTRRVFSRWRDRSTCAVGRWIGNARSPASDVRIVVDGSHEIKAAYGHTRQDIANVFGSSDLARCGFEGHDSAEFSDPAITALKPML